VQRAGCTEQDSANMLPAQPLYGVACGMSLSRLQALQAMYVYVKGWLGARHVKNVAVLQGA
jgi:hypothetical protein